jgi:hypothetical protein
VLQGVSCMTSSVCFATGWSSTATGISTLIEESSGGTWTVVPSPNRSGAINELFGVSCRVAQCFTVGGSGSTGSHIDQTLVEQLSASNGTWTIVPSQTPSGFAPTLLGVDCPPRAIAICRAVGSSAPYFAASTTLVEESPRTKTR